MRVVAIQRYLFLLTGSEGAFQVVILVAQVEFDPDRT